MELKFVIADAIARSGFLTFGSFLKALRKRSRYTQGELAKLSGMKQATLSSWERDRWAPRKIQDVEKIREVLDLSKEVYDQLMALRARKDKRIPSKPGQYDSLLNAIADAADAAPLLTTASQLTKIETRKVSMGEFIFVLSALEEFIQAYGIERDVLLKTPEEVLKGFIRKKGKGWGEYLKDLDV